MPKKLIICADGTWNKEDETDQGHPCPKLSFLAEKAGLMTFDLRELLDEYLGDVQIVAEFEDYRGDILERFRATMSALCEKHKAVKHIHIVAHSEGTVVAFRGLLEPVRHAARVGAEDAAKGGAVSAHRP